LQLVSLELTRFVNGFSSFATGRSSFKMKKNRMRNRYAVATLILAIAVVGTVAHAQVFYTDLYDLGTHSGDPISPQYAGVIAQGRDGNLYSSALGGTDGGGAMFKVTPGGELTVQYSFDYEDEAPFSGLTLGTDGSFYGGTNNGGSFHLGTVFKITPSGTLTVLHNFDEEDGSTVYSPPIQGTDGNFYGTTFAGGSYNGGTVYKMTPSGQLTTLHQFNDPYTRGIWPTAPLVQGTDENFYGTTNVGGIYEDGVVFKITPAGKFTVLHTFDGTHGARPYGPLVQGSDGNFYGTTFEGGDSNYGVVFMITPKGKFSVLHNINGTTDGMYPYAGLVQANDGNFYGTNSQGPTGFAIFRISPRQHYDYSVLYTSEPTEGFDSEVTLVQHTNGILYGETMGGGTAHQGTFFSLYVGLKPFVSLVSISGRVGKTIEILGQRFKGTTDVSFNGTPATFKVVSDTYLTANVPSGATTGFVTVTTPKGKLTSNKKFRVK
jgi:uncharacterized repeat protein (TIGR03803 family)